MSDFGERGEISRRAVKWRCDELDLFVADPFGFDEVYTRRVTMAIAPHVEATFVGLADLVRMKKVAGRPQDLTDIEQLEDLTGEPEND